MAQLAALMLNGTAAAEKLGTVVPMLNGRSAEWEMAQLAAQMRNGFAAAKGLLWQEFHFGGWI